MAKTIYEIYEDVIKIGKRFPLFTWDQPDSKEVLCKLLRYVVLDKLKLSKEQFTQQYSLGFLTNHKLGSAFRKLYKRNLPAFATDTFPEWELKPWGFQKVHVAKTYWTHETAKEATKWLVEGILQWDLEKVCNEISDAPFHENGLGGMLRTLKIGGAYAVVRAYPEYDWTYLKERKGYKITEKQAEEIKQLHRNGLSQRELSHMYNCNPTAIFYIVHNKTFKN